MSLAADLLDLQFSDGLNGLLVCGRSASSVVSLNFFVGMCAGSLVSGC